MPYYLPEDLDQIVKERVATGRYRDADDLLRAALTALDEADANLAAIEASISEWKAGDDGLPLDNAFTEIRSQRHGLTDQ